MIMKHGSYFAAVSYEDGDTDMHGVVINTRDVLHFAGRDIDELRTAFADTIDFYREQCAKDGVEPEKPFSGTFTLRLDPELHRRVVEKAAESGESVNQFIVQRLEDIRQPRRPIKAEVSITAPKRLPKKRA